MYIFNLIFEKFKCAIVVFDVNSCTSTLTKTWKIISKYKIENIQCTRDIL